MDEFRCSISWIEDRARRSPGRLTGVLLTYGQRTSRMDIPKHLRGTEVRGEVFEDDSLRWENEGIPLNRGHRRDNPITMVQPEARGRFVMVDVELPDTAAGREAAAEVRGGKMRGLSVEFKPLNEDVQNGLRIIREANLSGAAIVTSPAYSGSGVEVRATPLIRIPLLDLV